VASFGLIGGLLKSYDNGNYRPERARESRTGHFARGRRRSHLRDLAEKVRARFPGTASILDSMREEETSHRARLHDFYLGRFGDHVLTEFHPVFTRIVALSVASPVLT